VEVKWSVTGPEGSCLTVEGGSAAHREVLVNVDAGAGRVRLTDCEGRAQAHYLRKSCLPLPALPMPMVADLDGDGTNAVLVQDARWVKRAAVRAGARPPLGKFGRKLDHDRAPGLRLRPARPVFRVAMGRRPYRP
jgi:hypothetical protein